MNKLWNRLNHWGFRENLTFSSQEALSFCVFGFDGVHNKILILDNHYVNKPIIVDLAEVKNCVLKKVYRSIKAGSLRNKKLDEYLQKIVLHFEFFSGRQPVEIPFYHNEADGYTSLQKLEKKANRWKIFLSKMLKTGFRKNR